MITMRKATVADIGDIIALAKAHAHKYLDDRVTLDDQVLIDGVMSGHIVIAEERFRLYGVFMVSDFQFDETAHLHALIVPSALRKMFPQLKNVFAYLLTEYKLLALYAELMKCQRQAIKLVVRNNFRHIGTRDNAGLKDGKRVDVELFEYLAGHESRQKHHAAYIKKQFGFEL